MIPSVHRERFQVFSDSYTFHGTDVIVTDFYRPLSLFATPLGDEYEREGVRLHHSDVTKLYEKWETPTLIISDGAYGLGLFPGDPVTPSELVEWYRPHVEKWSEFSAPYSTLWFWNSELGWATVHPLLIASGWRFVNCHIWDKGIAHIAGNSNTQVLRKFPVVTEVCVQYVREVKIDEMPLKRWLRSEWQRAGIPLNAANAACGVKNAATRKYLTQCHLWYFPPPEVFARLVAYANQYGKKAGYPYFSSDGKNPLNASEWELMRAKFHCKTGITNVWNVPPLNGKERVRNGTKSVHANQKPLELMELIIDSSTDKGDVVWEPFGGLCTAAVASFRKNRRCESAEVVREFYELAAERLQNA